MNPMPMCQPRRGGLVGLIATLLLVMSRLTLAYDLDPDSSSSVKTIAKQMADDMLSFYHGDEPGNTPGLLPDPYYWWEAGAMLGALIDYWYYTADDDYVALTKQALLFQVGKNNDYMPINQTRTEGNDDQGFWGLAVMAAAEYNFPAPELDEPQWLALAQAVFNTQAARWETEYCGGGLRWQIFQWNTGFTYKNSISQACFFGLGARLALYTGNHSYAEWAEKTWQWMEDIEFFDKKTWYVYDGAHIESNCTKIVPYQFSYNAGGFIMGAAAMYNYTGSQLWKDRLDNLVEGAKVFFTGPNSDIMTEVACEPVNLCNVDQQSFKAYLSRWLAATTKWAPHTYNTIMPLLRASATAAAKLCVGGSNGRMCGLIWNNDTYDGSTGVGQQMAALEVTLSVIIKDRRNALTADTGGTSKGDPAGGGDDIGRTIPDRDWRPMSAGDKFGGAILTILLLAGFAFATVFLFLDETSDKTPVEQIKGFSSNASNVIVAIAAGGGIAALMNSRKKEDPANEKTAAGMTTISEQSSQVSSKQQGPIVTPIQVVNVRSPPEGHRRRVSSMPRGWPHNPAVRSSAMFDTDGIYSAVGQSSRNEVTNHPIDEVSPVQEGVLRSPEVATSQVPPAEVVGETTNLKLSETTNLKLTETANLKERSPHEPGSAL